MGTETAGDETNFMIRQNCCPKCGCYIWAHPILTDNEPQIYCGLTVAEAQEVYDHQVKVNRGHD